MYIGILDKNIFGLFAMGLALLIMALATVALYAVVLVLWPVMYIGKKLKGVK